MWRITLGNARGERVEARFIEESISETWERIPGGPLASGRERLGWSGEVVEKLVSIVPAWLVVGEEELLMGSGDLIAEPDLGSPLLACRLTPELEFPPGVLWTDESVVMLDKPEGVTEITFEYEETNRDADRRLSHEEEEREEAFKHLEWFAVIGPNSALTSGDEPLGKRTRIKTGSAAGKLVGRVVNTITPGPDHYQRDRLWKRRLTDLEGRDRVLAEGVPRLDPANHSRWLVGPEVTEGDVMDGCELVILVHGTVSCSMRMASAILRHHAARDLSETTILARFEHDTFHSLHANALSLAQHILAFFGRKSTYGARPRRVRKVLLVGHSRGGLVAAEAARLVIGLKDGEWPPPGPGDLEVLTFGTPHAGTPLVANITAVGGLIRAFIRASSRMAARHLGLDPVGWVAGFMTRFIHLPKGIAVMHPYSDYCLFRPSAAYDSPTTAYGASFDPHGKRDGFVPSFRGSFLEQVMNGMENDGVVPTASCIAGRFTRTRVVDDCAHSDYFEHDDVVAELWARMGRV